MAPKLSVVECWCNWEQVKWMYGDGAEGIIAACRKKGLVKRCEVMGTEWFYVIVGDSA